MTRVSRRSLLFLGSSTVIGVGAFAGFIGWTSRADGAGTMTPVEALEAASDGAILLVDIRRPDEWAATGMPVGSVAIDMRDDDFLEKLLSKRSSNRQPVALICARGIRSARLTRALEEAGIFPVIDVSEGMLGSFSGPGWLKRGLPVKQVQE